MFFLLLSNTTLARLEQFTLQFRKVFLMLPSIAQLISYLTTFKLAPNLFTLSALKRGDFTENLVDVENFMLGTKFH